jgi:hypothetical protein
MVLSSLRIEFASPVGIVVAIQRVVLSRECLLKKCQDLSRDTGFLYFI